MCECLEPGFCPLHNMYKNKTLFDHCKKGQPIVVNGKPIEPPSYLKRIASYAVAKVNHVLAGSPEVHGDLYKQRISICEACPLFQADKRICNSCGCDVDTKAKWADVSCPDNPPRWKAIIIEKACKTCG